MSALAVPKQATDPNLTEAKASRSERTLVLVPAYNEERSLRGVLQEVRRQQPEADILVVDDGSIDNTIAEARAAGALVARHPFNLGYGVALQTGYKFALERGYDFVLQIDGDGQHDPACLGTLLEQVRAGGTDVAIGSRFLWEGGYRPRLERRLGSWLYGRLATLFTGQRITDPTSGYWAMNRKALALCALRSFPHDYPDADVLIRLHRAGLALKELPVRMYPAKGNRSMHGGLWPFYYIYKMSLSIFVALLSKKPNG